VQLEDNERDLIQAAQEGDRSAFARIYEMHAGRVYRYLLRHLGNSADAEDVTAEVFVAAMRALHSYRAKGSPLIAWLLRIAHNKSVNYLKKITRRREVPILDNIAVSDDLEENLLKKAMLSETSQAMKSLTALQREVLILRFGEDLSLAETAKVMNRSVRAVKFLQYSALRALRRRLCTDEEQEHDR